MPKQQWINDLTKTLADIDTLTIQAQFDGEMKQLLKYVDYIEKEFQSLLIVLSWLYQGLHLVNQYHMTPRSLWDNTREELRRTLPEILKQSTFQLEAPILDLLSIISYTSNSRGIVVERFRQTLQVLHTQLIESSTEFSHLAHDTLWISIYQYSEYDDIITFDQLWKKFILQVNVLKTTRSRA